MNLDHADLFSLHIPFKMSFTHSLAKRLASDSFVIKLTAEGISGYGEAVIRDYVSGSVGEGKPLESISKITTRILETLRSEDLSLESLLAWSEGLEVEHHELPVLCAVETGLFDLLCKIEGADIYQLLGREPVRTALTYGGTLPMIPQAGALAMLELCKKIGISNLRLKVGNDTEYNQNLLQTAREMTGDDFDLRVDANCAWNLDTVFPNLEILQSFGITVVEEPFGRDRGMIQKLKSETRSEGFVFVADESALSLRDLEEIGQDKTFGIINIRLSKNGGLLRSLALAEAAAELGMQYQLGCHVGETGILSAAGRVAASLMEQPLYVDGSYDNYLLSDNIVHENLTFGPGGRAETVRKNGLGFTINTEKLKGLCNDHLACF